MKVVFLADVKGQGKKAKSKKYQQVMQITFSLRKI